MTASPPARVMIVDDHSIMRDGLREMLERSEDFQVAGQARDGCEAVDVARRVKPDVIIMDVIMPVKERCRCLPRNHGGRAWIPACSC